MLNFAVALQVILFLMAFAARAFFAGSEIAYLSVDKLAVKNLARKGSKKALLVDQLVSNMQLLIGVILIGTNLTGVLATFLATKLTVELGLFGNNGVAVSTSLMIVLILVFGEILPKNYFGRNADSVTLKLAKPTAVVGKVFGPLANLFCILTRRLTGSSLQSSSVSMTEESIKTMVTMGEEEGFVAESEREMIYGVFESNKTLVREIMVPRVDMVAADVEDGLSHIVHLIVESGFSRIPVYEDTIDNVIGIAYAKDVLYSLNKHSEGQGDISVKELLRAPIFVPETKKASELLSELRAKGVHIAIVLDEYGGTEGLASIEDVLEEIVGEIQDEYDEEELPPVVLKKHGEALVDGRVTIDDLNEILQLDLPNDEVDTIGGLVYEVLGRIPLKGEEVNCPYKDIKLKVVELDGRKISRVKILNIND